MESDQCLLCKHYKLFGRCTAYLKKIPIVIFTGQHDHHKPFKGDKGILFKKRKGL